MKRPSAKQLAARKKFAAMARARGKAARRTRKRATTQRRKVRVPTMARRRRRRATTPVARRRRRRTFASNPVRRTRRAVARRAGRRRYRRNPGFGSGMVGQAMDLIKNAGGIAVGVAGSKFVAGLIPTTAGAVPNPFFEFAKNSLIAIGFKVLGRRFVGGLADRVAEGAMYRAIKNLAVAQVPTMAAYLGGGDEVMYFPQQGWAPQVSSYSGVGSYAPDGSVGDYGQSSGGYTQSDGYGG